MPRAALNILIQLGTIGLVVYDVLMTHEMLI